MLKAGIVGLPNVGKSTLFNALTRSRKAEAANYPFCTIEPNIGVVEVPDERLKPLAEISKTNVIIPAAVEFVDIAGLVAGASKGEGLGNKFLANIREVDAIVHVVRCFDDDDILHSMGSVDPVRDIEIITTELVLSDLQSCEKQLDNNARKAKGMDKEAIKNVELLKRLIAHLNEGKPAITLPDVSEEDAARIKSYFLLTSKPVIYACNVAESDIGDGGASNAYVAKVREFAKNSHDADSCVICARLEEELSSLEPDEAKEYLAELGATDSGVSELIKKTYDIYNLDYDKIAALDGFKKTSANNIRKSVEKSKSNDLSKLIFALGIRHIGAKAAKLLSDRFKNVDAIMQATVDDILQIDGYGLIMAESVVNYFSGDSAVELVNKLKEAGVNVASTSTVRDDRFAGMTFVLTGTLPTLKRSEASKIIESFAGKTSSSVSKKTTYVLAGEEAGSKLDKANQLGIEIINEEQFLKMTE